MTRIRCLVAGGVILGVLGGPLGAQTPPDAGQLLNQQQRNQPEPPRATTAPEIKEPAAAAAPLAQGLQIILRSVRFTGADSMGAGAPAELQRLIAPALGRTLDHAALQGLATEVGAYLRGKGFVLARAYLPRQDVTDGEIEIAILDGRLETGPDRIVVKSTARIDSARIQAIAQAALPEASLRDGDLERALLLISDLPGVTARSALERGRQPGTSRLIIEASQDRFATGSLSVDNFSNRSTGQLRGSAQAALLNPLGRGDVLSLALSGSSGTLAAAGDYSLLLLPQGLRLNAGVSYLNYDVGGDLKDLDLTGTATTASTGLEYPLIRSRKTNLFARVGLEHRALTDEGLGVNLRDRRLNTGALTLNGTRFDEFAGGGVFDGSLGLTQGVVDLSRNSTDAAADLQTARTDGSYTKLHGRLSRLQNLGHFDGGRWSLFAVAAGQLASSNLDSSEKFILGGPGAVRAYPIGEAPGDHGWLTNLELRRALSLSSKVKAQAFGFFDLGQAWLHDRPWRGSIFNAENTNRITLKGGGIGGTLWLGKCTVRLTAGRAVGDNPGRSIQGENADGRSGRTQFWAQASYVF